MADDVRDWSDLVLAAGLNPDEVEVTVVRKRRLRGAPPVLASHSSRGLSCEAQTYGSIDENAAAAIAGLVDLLTGGAY